MNVIYNVISSLQSVAPWFCIALFLAASFLVVWRLEILASKGVEGTVLGTVVMPFCSGMGNIIFAFALAMNQGDSEDVIINCMFNNMTNLTILIGLPALIWGMTGIPKKISQTAIREFKMGRLSLVLNLVAAFFFSLFIWFMASDGEISRQDGMALIALFIFWICFHAYDVQKTNLFKDQKYPTTLLIELLLLLVGAFFIYISTNWLVRWVQTFDSDVLPTGFLGWMSGILMVLPNALLAFYYGMHHRMDVVYTSQSGDAHICIPLSIGIFAACRGIPNGQFLQLSLFILMGLFATHLLLIGTMGRLSRLFAALIIVLFIAFLWAGLTTS